MKVRVGAKYRYTGAALLDRTDGHPKPDVGEVVTVGNLPGAPKANTMGMCYVFHQDGKFAGMVMTASLEKVGK